MQHVDNVSMMLDFHDECREKAIYIPGTLKVHYIKRTVSKLGCKFTFFITYQSKEALKERLNMQFPVYHLA